MNNSNARPKDSTDDHQTVLWSVYEDGDYVHAVADVPQSIPKQKLGFGASTTEATVFVGTPARTQWSVSFPTRVNPTPVRTSYNNGVVEVVFRAATPTTTIDVED